MDSVAMTPRSIIKNLTTAPPPKSSATAKSCTAMGALALSVQRFTMASRLRSF